MKILFAFLPSLLAASDSVIGFEWGTVSATGLLGWYLWYTTRVVMPRHQAQITDMQKSFNTQSTSQRDHYEVLIDNLQRKHERRDEKIVAALDKLVDRLDP
jgi:hypothetical protein